LALGAFVRNVLLPLLVFLLTLWQALMVWVAYAIMVPKNDFGRFYYTTAFFRQGQDMYCWHPALRGEWPGCMTLSGEPLPIDLYNMNPPHAHLPLLPLISLSPALAMAVWHLAGLACLLASAWIIVRELKLVLAPWERDLGLVILLASEMTRQVVVQGQVTWFLLLLVTLMWRAARHDRWAWAGAWLGVLAATKPFLVIFVPWFVLQGRWRALAAAAGAAVACFAVGLLVFGLDNHRTWVAAMARSDSWAWVPQNSGLWAFLTRTCTDNPMYVPVLSLSVPMVKAIWLVIGGVLGLLMLVGVYRDRSPERIDRAFAVLLVGSILFCPLGWVYYFWLPLGPLAAMWQRWKLRPGRRHWLLLALALPGLLWSIDWTALGQPSAWATVTIGNAFVWTVLLLWLVLLLDSRGRLRERFAKGGACHPDRPTAPACHRG
jgi:hypothetical protein